MCIHPYCKTQPIFNKKVEKPLYCLKHKLDDMVDVKNKRCIYIDCKKQPHFNIENEKAIYCLTHKKENMIDVNHGKCIYKGCKIRPSFNVEGKKALYCVTHKQSDMVNVIDKKCIYNGCKKIPHFNIKGEKAIYCASHKKENMIDLINKLCKSEWCSTLVRDKYDGYCLFCYTNLFPENPVSCNYKNKEYSVVEYIKIKFPFPWIADKRITGGCSKRRPDLLLDLIDQIIIVEIDENQHIDYDCSCENKRIMELSQDLAHRPIVFIRFNPDDYKKGDEIIRSCWSIGNKGVCVVKKSKEEEWTHRLNILCETIEYWLKNKTDKIIEIIQLFYDI